MGKLSSGRAIANIIAGVAVALALVATINTNGFTIIEILRAPTRVPFADEWAMIQEFILYKRGSPLWPILWSSYWGHRFVIPRLVFFANLQWGSRESLVWLSCGLQLAQIAFVVLLSWLLLGRRSLLLFVVSIVVILSLMISPFQMENFIWSMQFTFPLVYVAAGLSFLSLALYYEKPRGVFLVIGTVTAVVASYTMANGIIVWPVLVAQAAYLKLNRRLVAAVGLGGTSLIASYCWHYQTPPLGTGVLGFLRHPIDGVLLLALLLAAALKSLPFPFAIGATLTGLVGAIYTGLVALRDRNAPRSWLSVLVAFLIFFVLTATSVVTGRMSPQWLTGNIEVPGRYFTLIEGFWTSLAILVLYAACQLRRFWLLLGFYALLYFCIMFPEHHLLISAAEDWSDFFRGVDAVGTAFIVDAPDEKLLSILWPVKPQREEIVSFMRNKHIGIFAEGRSSWPGRNVRELFPVVSSDRCVGSIEQSVSLHNSSAYETWRIQGWGWDSTTNREIDYLFVTDPAGLIVGIARGGFRHGYFPGFFVDSSTEPPPYHTRFRTSEWLGYARQSVRSAWTVYGLVSRQQDEVCLITSDEQKQAR